MSEKKQIKTVVVFCSSRMGVNPVYAAHAAEIGRLLGENGFDLVYGGGMSGLMGVVAESAQRAGSHVIGIITHAFRKAAFYQPLPGAEEIAVRTLPARKKAMLDKADACIVLAGGIGTLDEQWEAAALIDMNMASRSKAYIKPIIVLNTNGIYNDQKEGMRRRIAEGFIHPGREKMIRSVDTPEAVIRKLKIWNEEGILRACDIVERTVYNAHVPANVA
jgi:uncharacterized protein (TIGR00730 family)